MVGSELDHVALSCAGQAPQRSKRLVEAAVAALRSRDAAKQHKAIDAILRDAHARVPRAHWAAEWTAAQALPVSSRWCRVSGEANPSQPPRKHGLPLRDGCDSASRTSRSRTSVLNSLVLPAPVALEQGAHLCMHLGA